MSLLRRLGFAALIVACCPWSTSQAGVYVGIGYGGPAYYRPYYGHTYRYLRLRLRVLSGYWRRRR